MSLHAFTGKYFYGAAIASIVSLVFLAIAATIVPHGIISVDELLYYLSSEALVKTGWVALQNGYPEFPSPAFIWRGNTQMAFVHEGQLYSQYPPGYEFIAYPFFAILKGKGLILMNALAFVLSSWLVFYLAKRLYESQRIGVAAALIYAFATPSLGYALAIWPHSLATFWALLSIALALLCQTPVGFLFSGLSIGIGFSIRYDLMFIFASIIGALLFAKIEGRWKKLAFFLLGFSPLMMVLSYVQFLKFGIYFPVSYGPNPLLAISDKLAVFPLAIVGVCLVFLLTRSKAIQFLKISFHKNKRLVLIVAMLFLGMLWFLVPSRLQNYSNILLSFSWESLYPREQQSFSGTEHGGFAPFGSLKKALFQSAPLLILCLFPQFRMLSSFSKLLLIFCPLSFIIFFGYFGWHGGFSSSMRYLTPIFPCMSILVAPYLSEIRFSRANRLVGMLCTAVFLVSVAFINSPLEYLFRFFPVAIVISLSLAGLRMFKHREHLNKLIAAAFLWGVLMNLYDVSAELRIRHDGVRFARELSQKYSSPTLVLTGSPLYLFLMREYGISAIASSGLARASELVELSLRANDRGRNVLFVPHTPHGTLKLEGMLREGSFSSDSEHVFGQQIFVLLRAK